MAISATTLYASSILPKAFTSNPTKSSSRSHISVLKPNHLIPSSSYSSIISLRISTPTAKASAATSTTYEIDQAPVSTTPSKSLPFRIGHGFDLHRLEPGFPLIIGGINIPHDRGCEAHSDGNFFLLL